MEPAIAAALIGAGAALAGSILSLLQVRSLRTEVYLSSAQEIGKRRLDSYSALWEITSEAKPSSPDIETLEKRRNLQTEMTDWYYRGGAGMLLSPEAREFFVRCKKDLVDESVTPEMLVNQLSSLRSLLKADIRGLYDDPKTYREL